MIYIFGWLFIALLVGAFCWIAISSFLDYYKSNIAGCIAEVLSELRDEQEELRKLGFWGYQLEKWPQVVGFLVGTLAFCAIIGFGAYRMWYGL